MFDVRCLSHETRNQRPGEGDGETALAEGLSVGPRGGPFDFALAKGKSLLPPGAARCEGDFAAEDVVRICDLDGTEFARGIAAFGSSEIKARTLQRVEVVHRDNLVIL
jgi:hypothetical protein